MKAFHLYWSKPRAQKASLLKDYEIALLAISALAYHEVQGKKPYLLIDRPLLEFLRPFDIFGLWEKIDIDLIAEFENEYPQMNASFSNAAKMYALGKLSLPFIMLDADAILYEAVPKKFFELDFGYAHTELDPDFTFYPDAERLRISMNWSTEEAKKINQSPIMNMSCAFLNHAEFQNELYKKFFFITSEPRTSGISPLNLLTFSEQRMAGYLCTELKLKHDALLGYEWSCTTRSFVPTENRKTFFKFHHLWHQKKSLSRFSSLQKTYFEGLLTTLEENLPGFKVKALKINVLRVLLGLNS